MAPPDPAPGSFWTQVRLNVVSWLVVCAVGGIGYVTYVVPRMLERVLDGQRAISVQASEFAEVIKDHERRITVLESQRRSGNGSR